MIAINLTNLTLEIIKSFNQAIDGKAIAEKVSHLWTMSDDLDGDVWFIRILDNVVKIHPFVSG